MCGRFSLEQYPDTLIDQFDLPTYPKFKAKYNIAPASNVLTIFKSENDYSIGEMHWGVIPPWAKAGQFKKPLINARSETIWEKPSFKTLVKKNRCIILANGFYEWKRSGQAKQPYRITIKNDTNMAMAGIYQISKEGELQCCITTMQANDDMQEVHHRMPVILNEGNLEKWMQANSQKETQEVFNESIQTKFNINKISSYVNNAANQGEECVRSI